MPAIVSANEEIRSDVRAAPRSFGAAHGPRLTPAAAGGPVLFPPLREDLRGQAAARGGADDDQRHKSAAPRPAPAGARALTPARGPALLRGAVTPMECRTRGLTYSAPIYVDIKFTQGKRVVKEQGVVIGKLPIMLRSRKCVLAGKTEPELARLKECPYDPGGYFVVRGGEKVILIQEQLSKNRVLIENDEKGQVGASVTSSTHERKSRSNIVQRKGRLYIRHNILATDLPVVVLLKAMGISSDMEIVSLVGPEVEVRNAMAPSLQECAELEVHSQNQALAYVGRHVRTARNRPYARRRSPVEEGRGVLSAVLLPHVPVHNFDFREKAVFVAYMVRRVILATKGLGALSDKDYYGNKRLELAGAQLSLLFEDLFKQFNARIKMHVDKELAKANRAHDFNVMRHMVQWQDILTGGFVQALATGNWTLKRFRMDKKGVTEVRAPRQGPPAQAAVTRRAPFLLPPLRPADGVAAVVHRRTGAHDAHSLPRGEDAQNQRAAGAAALPVGPGLPLRHAGGRAVRPGQVAGASRPRHLRRRHSTARRAPLRPGRGGDRDHDGGRGAPAAAGAGRTGARDPERPRLRAPPPDTHPPARRCTRRLPTWSS